ncbi:MAG TPA: hypothetical protein VHT51_14040 [Micropepsaceae bacterium]|jgi:hypothetical protein|nr:hypothetical protein [Micropepsaceae bacterium]
MALGRVIIGIAVLAASGASARAADGAIPDFSGIWGRNTFDFEALPSGPAPITNSYRMPMGGGDPTRPMGDYKNPLLKPEAAVIVKQRAEKAMTGATFPDPSTRCAPYNPPFIFAMQLGMQFLQTKNAITILYNQDDQVRYIRLNAKHPDHVTPSWKGDSIAHYEGDMLVIDTVGIKSDAQSVVDRYGTPLGEGAHVVERYRLIDAGAAKQAQAEHEKEAGRLGGALLADEAYAKGVELQLTIENPVYFKQPLPVRVTYRRTILPWQEQVCAENADNQYAVAASPPIPKADKPDF